MTTLPSATTRSRGSWTRAAALQPLLVPLASLLLAVTLLGTGWRLLLVVALPALVIGAFAYRLPRSAAAGAALLLGVRQNNKPNAVEVAHYVRAMLAAARTP